MNRHSARWAVPLVLALGCGDDGATTADARVADAAGDTSPDGAPTRDSAAGDGSTTCDSFEEPIVLGNAASPALVEVSGVAASRRSPEVLWVHNDSGDSPRVFALRTDGAHLGEYRLTGATHVDWEDIAIGPGPEAGRDYLYVGDVGDNAARDTGVGRAYVVVYRVPEPEVSRDQAPVTMDVAAVEALALAYPEAPHDCEAVMVDPATGDLYLLTKDNDGMSELYVARAPLAEGATTTLERVGDLVFGAGATPGGPLITAGDLSVDGGAILVRTYAAVLFYRRPEGGTVADALTTSPLRLPAAAERQGEGLAWAPDGRGYYTISEFSSPRIHFYAAGSSCAL